VNSVRGWRASRESNLHADSSERVRFVNEGVASQSAPRAGRVVRVAPLPKLLPGPSP